MDKELQRFLSGETNFYKGEISIAREQTNRKDNDYYEFYADDKMLKAFWGKLGEPPKKKSMAGKKPYTMIMNDNLLKLDISINEIGCLTKLSPFIEWGTGKVIHKRSKKPLSKSEIETHLGISHNTWSGITKNLKNKNLMTVTKDGYFISTELFKKGKTK